MTPLSHQRYQSFLQALRARHGAEKAAPESDDATALAKRIIEAGKLRRSGDCVPKLDPNSLAAQIVRAGARRRGEIP
jgi:hypothetical protein